MNIPRGTCPPPDALVAYGEGVLPETVETAVGEHVASCAVCARLRIDLRESPLAEPTLAELNRFRKRERSGPRKTVGIAAAGAIAAALAAGVYFRPESRPSPTPIAATAPKQPGAPAYRLAVEPAPLRLPFAMALILRGQSAPPRDGVYLKRLGEALDPYRAGQYDEAARRLAALARQYPRAVEPPFYEGVSLLLTGGAKAALSRLEAARAIGGEALGDDIDWYLAAARERNGNWEAAAALLKKQCAAEGPHRDAACKALAPQ